MGIQGNNLTTSAFIATVMLTIFAAMTAGPAVAAAPTPVQQKVLTYSHLDLNSMAGIRRLYSRIQKAAATVCGNRRPAGSRITSQQWRNCRDVAVSDAVARLNKPALSAYHQRRTAGAS